MLRGLYHYAHAIDKRLFQLCEASLLRNGGCRFSKPFFLKILKNPGAAEDWVNISRFIRHDEPVLLLDIGANIGEFTRDFLSLYRRGRSICFEPVAATFEILSRRFSGDSRVELRRTALREFDGASTIRLHADNTLATFTTFGAEANQFYKTQSISSEQVPCSRLDGLGIQTDGTERLFVKIDVQGLEVEVVRGASATLARADVVLVECSFAPEYVGMEASFPEVCRALHDHGLYPIVFQDYGRQLSNYAFERDVLFVRGELLGNIWFRNSPGSPDDGKGQSY